MCTTGSRGIRSLVLELTGSESPCEDWAENLGPLQEFSTAKPPLQPHHFLSYTSTKTWGKTFFNPCPLMYSGYRGNQISVWTMKEAHNGAIRVQKQRLLRSIPCPGAGRSSKETWEQAQMSWEPRTPEGQSLSCGFRKATNCCRKQCWLIQRCWQDIR